MEILAGIVIGFLFIQLGVALSNWLSQTPLPQNGRQIIRQTSILIPARNEEKNLPLLLSDLLKQAYPPLEIIICDDHSEDDTYSVVNQLATQHPNIRIFRSAELPDGWLGKNFACYQLARRARGNYLLFLDADVRIGKDGIDPLLRVAQELQAGLLSVFPRQIMQTNGEKATVPLMTYILLTLLPLSLVYKIADQSALAAANGQFMLFQADSYHRLQPHREVRDNAVEDIAISRLYKKAGMRVACLTGIRDISCRMYTSRHQAIDGFARNIAGFFGNSLILGFLFWVFTGWGWLITGLAFGWKILFFYFGLRAIVRILVARTCHQSLAVNLIGSIAQQWNMGFILFRAFLGRRRKHQEWKGRNILNVKHK